MVRAGDDTVYVDIGGNTYEEGLQLPYLDLQQQLDLQRATVEGDADLHRLSADRIYGHDAYVRNEFDISRSSVRSGVGLTGMDVRRINGYLLQTGGDIDIRDSTARHVMLQGADIGGTLRLGNNEQSEQVIDLRGANIGGIEDRGGAYRMLVDEDTRIGSYRRPLDRQDRQLTENQERFLRDVRSLPRFPLGEQHGVCFTIDWLRKELVMDDNRLGTLGSLVADGAIERIDRGDQAYFLARSDVL